MSIFRLQSPLTVQPQIHKRENRMATEKHDVVIIGGGHNGLIVAVYLAKAGLDVCVVESQDKIGGGVKSEELTLPGFIHDPASVMHGTISSNPLIHRDELGLKSKYGLKYIYPEKEFACIFPDNTALVFERNLDRTCESISKVSHRDAEAYRKLYQVTSQMLKVASVAMFSPPPSWGAMVSLFDASEEGREFLRVILSSAWDIVEDWFESDKVKIALTRFCSEMMVGPEEKGTGSAMFFVSSLHAWGWPLPVGGSGALTEALSACLKDLGGTIKVSCPVKTVKVESGEAKGVILHTNEEIAATKAVVSNVNVKQLFLDMLPPEKLSPDFQRKIRRLRPATFSALNQALALNDAPKYRIGEEVESAFFVEICPFKEDYLRIFDNFKYGVPNSEMPVMGAATVFDPSRAPIGKHTFYLYHYEPYDLKMGGASHWDEIRQEVADKILETAQKYSTNLIGENILGRWLCSPLDIERMNPAMRAGDLGHIGHFLTQSFASRPISGWGNYRTPIKRLYMCGASTHPGIGVTGGGRASVQVIMEDLGIDFKKVIGR